MLSIFSPTTGQLYKIVKIWSTENVEQLQGCYECTDWNVFIDSSADVHEATDVISSYVTFCEEMITPQKIVKIYPNNKPWISKSLNQTINEKKAAIGRTERKFRRNSERKLG